MMAKVQIRIVDIATLIGIPAKLDAIYLGHPGLDWHVPTGPDGVVDTNLGAGDYVITVSSAGYSTFDWPVHIELDGTITQGLVKISGGAAIGVQGREFTIGGQRYKPKMCSDFLLVYKKMQGIDITNLLTERKQCGADMLRIFTMAKNIADFNPRTYDVFSTLTTVLNEIHSFGMRAQVEGFADVQLIDLTLQEQLHHQDVVCDVIRRLGAMDLYDLGNETDKNGIDPNNFPKPSGVISSKGSLQNNAPPPAPYWDYGVYHPRRDGTDYYFSKFLSDMTPQSELYVGVQGRPPMNCPVFPDEPIGFQAVNDPGRRSNHAGYAYRVGSIYSMYLNGSCFHSTNGVFSEPFDAVTAECAIACFNGMDDARQGW
jgi:hypothetical protein